MWQGSLAGVPALSWIVDLVRRVVTGHPDTQPLEARTVSGESQD